MSTATVLPMGKGRGRPPKPEDEAKKPVKLNADLVEMITWIVRIAKEQRPNYTAAELVDPLLRPQIKARYKLIKERVDEIKKSMETASENLADEE